MYHHYKVAADQSNCNSQFELSTWSYNERPDLDNKNVRHIS